MKKMFFAVAFVFMVLAPLVSSAVNPAVTSFSVSPSSGPSGYFFAFLWSLENAFGSSFLISCIQGVILKDISGGAVACGARIASQVATNDGRGVKIINVSGNQASVSARVIPKDSSGKDYDAGGQTVYIAVSPNPQPIEKFTASATTTISGKPVAISWSSTDLDNVNLSIECKPEIKVSSPSYTAGLYLPCGKPAFQADLPKSGSLTLNFSNSSVDALPYTFTLLPAMAPGVYNAIYTAVLTIMVASDVVPDPVVNYFKTSAPSPVYSGQAMPISWSTENTKGVNLKISCAEGVAATSSKNPSAALTCDGYAFSDNNILPSSGNLNLSFQNNGDSLRTVTINLVPAFKVKIGYDLTRSKTISMDVRKQSSAPPATIAPPPLQSPAISQPKLTPAPPVGAPAPAQKALNQKPPSEPAPAAAPAEEKIPERKIVAVKNTKIKKAEEITKLLIEKKYADTVERVELNSDFGIYNVVGSRKAALFNLVPVRLKVDIMLDAADGEVFSVRLPWWSFLTKY